MNKILFVFLLALFASFNANAQLRDTLKPMVTHSLSADLLFQKSKKQKAAAWVLLGGGAGLVTSGFLIGGSSDSFDDNKLTTGALLVVTGGIAMVGSIPFFIASGTNKRKAELTLKNESNSLIRPLNGGKNFIALGISIRL
ncbi:MAG: hypothetical protein ABIU11_07070 [Chitinophagaceae bacterium]